MLKVGLICAGVRTGGYSQRVARHLEKILAAKSQVTVDYCDLQNQPVPLFQKRIAPEQDGLGYHARLAACQAILWVSPEYNGGYSAILKNFIDSYDPNLFATKPLGICSVSAGALAGSRGAHQMQLLSTALFAIASPRMLLVANVGSKYNDQGHCVDEAHTKSMQSFADTYLAHCQRLVSA